MTVQEKVQKALKDMGDERFIAFETLKQSGEAGNWIDVVSNSTKLIKIESRIEGFVAALELLKAPQAQATQSAASTPPSDIAV